MSQRGGEELPSTPSEAFLTARESPSQNAQQTPECYFPIVGETTVNVDQEQGGPPFAAGGQFEEGNQPGSYRPSTSSGALLDSSQQPTSTEPRAASSCNPTLPRGQLPNWREIKRRLQQVFKINHAAAQVACTIVLVSLFTLIRPIEEAYPSNTVYITIAAVVVTQPNQTASVRLFAQRLIGVIVAAILSLCVLGLDAIIPPKSCLDCSWKPYAIGVILFIFIYTTASVRESLPGQAYTTKLTDLTFVITLLGAYDDLLHNPDTPRYAPPLARMASMIIGTLLSLAGAFIFWPVRITLVHRVVTGNLFKDIAGYFHDLVHEGYLREPSQSVTPASPHRLETQWSSTSRTIAVEGGMDILGSEEAVTAQPLEGLPKRGIRAKLGWLLGKAPPSETEHRPAAPRPEQSDITSADSTTADQSILTLDDWERVIDDAVKREEEDIVKEFHEKTHPAAVHIIRTLEKERARLEASYQVEVRWTQSPHFVHIAPLDQVIRRLRLLFYQLAGLYSDRLITLRALSPRLLESAHLVGNTIMSEWLTAWTLDAAALMHAMAAQPLGDTESFHVSTYTTSLCNALTDLGDVVLWTTSQGTRVIGSAELSARLEVIVQEVIKRRDVLETHLLKLRTKLMNPSQGDDAPDPSHKGKEPCGCGKIVASKGVSEGQAPNESPPVLAFQYTTYVHLWEITEVVLSAARAVGRMINAYA
ncbi:uncharacterized protein SPPG_00297 [Spizellomyces punctatus DAOM BR117]|uniref:Integral membrane bound transporter domain-containing protein n=1 Tax=Spizellomyces punctatus (strain DAOM BR117) TaxID=645134 RepID=A0A0L0HU26_SPIPD|nr:uncharacterized protein SPPG_00297 [Spizellomyces punctatus DAOM BR117]KND04577.1 hypothetical protein SPPG_00297 [Spizellomyces punctatus DAOM BR117]|eukprot:XP_016612616.1 hypothetical protein SPPG_00297 [Spizellomyces punctatus DAOM BR117]